MGQYLSFCWLGLAARNELVDHLRPHVDVGRLFFFHWTFSGNCCLLPLASLKPAEFKPGSMAAASEEGRCLSLRA